MADLSPEEIAFFAQQRRRIEDAFNQGITQNAFETKTLGGEKTRQLQELMSQLDQLRQGIAGDYAASGTLNSGLYQKAVSEFNEGAQRQQGLLEGSFADRLGALNLAKQQLEQTRGSSLADISQQEATRKAELAASITSALQGSGFGAGPLGGGGGGGQPSYTPRGPRTPRTPRTPRIRSGGVKAPRAARMPTAGRTASTKSMGRLRKPGRRIAGGGGRARPM